MSRALPLAPRLRVTRLASFVCCQTSRPPSLIDQACCETLSHASGWRARIRTWNKDSKGPCDTVSPPANVLTKTSLHGAALAVNRLARRRGTTWHGVRCSRSSTCCVPARSTAPMLASPGREMTLVSKSTSWRRTLERAAFRRITGCAGSRAEPLATVSQPTPHGSAPAARSLVPPSGSSLREHATASRPGRTVTSARTDRHNGRSRPCRLARQGRRGLESADLKLSGVLTTCSRQARWRRSRALSDPAVTGHPQASSLGPSVLSRQRCCRDWALGPGTWPPDSVSSPHRYCRNPRRGAPGRETLTGSIATSERWIKPAPEELCRGGTRISGSAPLSSTPRVFCSTGGRRSRCSRNPVQISSRLRSGGPNGALNVAWRIGVNLSAASSNGALNAARRPTRWKAVFDVAGPTFIGSVPTSTAVSCRGGGG